MDQLNLQQTCTPVDTIEFIFHIEKPNNIRATYVRAVCDIIPQKTENLRTRLTVGVNFIGFSVEVSTLTSDLTTITIHVNSAISKIKSIYLCMYVRVFLTGQPD